MTMKMQNYKDIDEYINLTPKETQETLEKIRKTIKQAAPEAEEAIRYSMPTFRLNGKNLIHFAAFRNHYGLYPAPGAIVEFEKELTSYKKSKGAIQFQVGEKIPYDLIKKIVKYRIEAVKNGEKEY